MAKVTTDFLAKEALRVYNNSIFFDPKSSTQGNLSILKTSLEFPGCYSVNSLTIGIVLDDGKFFAAPYTSHLEHLLKDAGFKKASFNVPFSQGEYPLLQKEKWDNLREKAHQSYVEELASNSMAYCDKHGIGSISDDVLSNCFEMPEEGIYVKHTCFETRYYPLIISSPVFSYKAMTKLGHFGKSNGKVVFVYRNGKTYVAKGYKIIDILTSAGYTDTHEFVPFSNNEHILDPEYAKRWASIKEF